MDAAGVNNSVLLDYDRNGGGSGTADMGLFVARSVFNGVNLNQNLYLYSKFGGDIAKGDADAGFEEWTAGKGTSPMTVPEPGAFALVSLIGMGFFMRRRR